MPEFMIEFVCLLPEIVSDGGELDRALLIKAGEG